jgi:hypothetical protein
MIFLNPEFKAPPDKIEVKDALHVHLGYLEFNDVYDYDGRSTYKAYAFVPERNSVGFGVNTAESIVEALKKANELRNVRHPKTK